MPLAPCKACGSRYCSAKSLTVCIHTGRERLAVPKQAIVQMNKQIHDAPVSKGSNAVPSV